MVHEVRSHMAATVLEVRASVGNDVRSGDVIVILESMKMEIPVLAPGPGRLVRVVAPGVAVTEGEIIAVLESD